MSIRVGVIGGGIYGTNILRTFDYLEKKEDLLTLVSLADIDTQKLKKHKEKIGISVYEDYEKMLKKENLDAVAIATPDHLHREVAIKCTKSGKHIFVQKPLDVSEEGCNEIIQIAKENNVLLQVDFHKRYDPAHIELKKAIQNDELGTIEYGYAWMEDTIEVPTEWLSWSKESSPVWFLGIHYFDLVTWLIRSEPIEVYATANEGQLKEQGIDTYDSVQASVKFQNGANIRFDCSWILPKSFEAIVNQGLRIVGTASIWEIDAQDRGIRVCSSTGMRTPNPYFMKEEMNYLGELAPRGYGIDSYRHFIQNLNYIKRNGSIEDLEGKYPSGEDGKVATRIASAVHKSIQKRQIINLEKEN